MGDVKRYNAAGIQFCLERERDELAEQLATAITDAHDERQDDRAELTRLRAVEKSAIKVVETADELQFGRSVVVSVGKAEMQTLAEACGRKG